MLQTHRFKTIQIGTSFRPNDKLFVFPNTLTTSIMPLDPSYFGYHEESINEEKISATMSLQKEITNLYTFAVYGRDFSRDKKTPISEEALNKLMENFEKRMNL